MQTQVDHREALSLFPANRRFLFSSPRTCFVQKSVCRNMLQPSTYCILTRKQKKQRTQILIFFLTCRIVCCCVLCHQYVCLFVCCLFVCMIQSALVDLVAIPECERKKTLGSALKSMIKLPESVITTVDIRVTMQSFKPELSY